MPRRSSQDQVARHFREGVVPVYMTLVGVVGDIDEVISSYVSVLPEPAQQHTLSPRERVLKKKFSVYKPSPVPTQDYREEFEQDGSSRWKMERWSEFRSRKLNSLIISIALHEMNRIRREGSSFTQEQIEILCFKKLDRHFFQEHKLDYPIDAYTAKTDGDSKAYTWDSAERTLKSAVAFAFDVWNPQVDDDLRRRASEAGMAFSLFDNVDDYLQVRGLSKSAAARLLGRSRNTIAKMFSHFEGMTDDELQALRGDRENTDGRLQKPHPGHGEASAVRRRPGTEVGTRHVELAEHDVSGSHGPNRDPESPEGFDGERRPSEYRGLT